MPRRRLSGLFLFLAVLGPGVISAGAGNDAGAVATYTTAGARYQYALLWAVLLAYLALILVQEMCARMGAVTQKGLAELIREEYGVRWTVFALVVMLAANLVVTTSEFLGVAAALEVYRVPPVASVIGAAALVALLVLTGSFRSVEKVFLALCLIFVGYIVAGVLSHPDWGQFGHGLLLPRLPGGTHFYQLLVAVIGTTIAPWMQFFLQSNTVDKGVKLGEYRYLRMDVVIGDLLQMTVAIFMVVCGATVLYPHMGPVTASQAAQALRPAAGAAAQLAFSAALLSASLLAAAVLPLTTAYTFCEAFGWEMGLRRSARQAPTFFAIFGVTLGLGAVLALLPKLPLFSLMILAQDVNGTLLPVVLVFMFLLASSPRVMGNYRNSLVHNLLAAATILAVVVASLAMVLTAAEGP